MLPGVHANGRYTLGENIADQGGLRIAMTAFLDAQEKKGVDIKSPEAKIDGFGPLQVFYMNYANLWANNIRDEEIRSLTTGDVHSLGCNRVKSLSATSHPFRSSLNHRRPAPIPASRSRTSDHLVNSRRFIPYLTIPCCKIYS